MQAEQANGPVLGVVLLDVTSLVGDFGKFEPTAERGLGALPPGSYSHPQTWPVRTIYARAMGATPPAVLRQAPAAAAGLQAAIARLDGQCDLITTDCGFFHGGLVGDVHLGQTPYLLSGLDLLGLALQVTNRHVAVLTYSASDCDAVLASHPQRARLEIVGLSDMPSWMAFGAVDFVEKGGWTFDALGRELASRVDEAISGRGNLGALVVECTAVPRFLHRLRAKLDIPTFDTHSMVCALLGSPVPELRA